MNGWVDDDDDDVEEEDDENEDVDIEEDNDAEIIFPYEVQGDQTPPPRDESSDSEFEAEESDEELKIEEDGVEPEVEEASVEPEIEEAGDEPEAEGADVELEAEEPDGESSTARDPQFVGGLAPWALRRDLEALRGQDMIREAESETSRTEIALLGSKAKIGKIEREILHHDLSGVEETLGKVVERLKVLESEENATLKKKLAEKEGFYLEMVRKGAVPKLPSDDEGSEHPRKMPKKSDEDEGPSGPRGPLMIMPPKPMSEARMREIIRDQFATSMNEFMANMNNWPGGSGGASGSGGAGRSGGTGGNADGTGVRGARPTVPELNGCTYATFIKCDPLPFNGTKGAVGLCQWFEKMESVFQISKCKKKDRVKFAMATLRGRALTWWNGRTKAMGIEAANNTPWSEWNERFYLEMVRKGAVPKLPSDDEGSKRPRNMPKKSDEDEGPSDPRGPLMIMPPKPMSEARMREIIRDQFATSMNEFMANMNNRAGGSGGASGSGGAGGSGGTGGNADGTGVRGAGPTVPELTRCTYATFIKCVPLPFNGTKGAVGLC
nr:putative zinc finger, CCHC-type, retrotransposon Gag domain protein [Tanacetum cinerariifolium]